MTHYAQLAEAVEYPRELDEDLVLRGSRATLDDLVDRFLDDDLDELAETHPGVSNYHIEQVADILADLLRDVPDEQSARRQLKRQAHWALLSERVSRLIELEEDNLSDPPTGAELLTLARRATDHLDPEGRLASGGRQDSIAGGGAGRSRSAPSASRTRTSEPLKKVLAELTDCSSRIRNAVDRLQRHRPVHASYARDLASRIDELVADAEEPEPG